MHTCLRCESANVWIGKVVMASGGIHVAAWCSDCERYARPGNVWLSKEEKVKLDIDSLPILANYLEDTQYLCSRCGSEGAQNHHWAPEAIFNDHNEWPQSYLCLKCHIRWHAEMNAWREKPLRTHHIAVTVHDSKAHIVVKDEKAEVLVVKDVGLKHDSIRGEWEAIGQALMVYRTTQDDIEKAEIKIYSDLAVIDSLDSLIDDSIWMLDVYRQLASGWNGRWNVIKIAKDRILKAG